MQQGSAPVTPVDLTGYLKAASTLTAGYVPKASSSTQLADSILKEVSSKLAVAHSNAPSAVVDVKGAGAIGSTYLFAGYNDSYQSVFKVDDTGSIFVNNPTVYPAGTRIVTKNTGTGYAMYMQHPYSWASFYQNGGMFSIYAGEDMQLQPNNGNGTLKLSKYTRVKNIHTYENGRFAMLISEAVSPERNYATVNFGSNIYQDTAQVFIIPQHTDITHGLNIRTETNAPAFLVAKDGGLDSYNGLQRMYSTLNDGYFSVYRRIAWHDGTPGGGNEIDGTVNNELSFISPNGQFKFNNDVNTDFALLKYTGSYLDSPLMIGARTANDASAVLQADHNAKGFLPPRMGTANFTAIGSKAEGLQAWSNDDHGAMWIDGSRTIGFRYEPGSGKFQGYDGNFWIDLN